MSSEHVEVFRDLSEVCRAAIKAGDWKVDGACDPDSLLRHADSAIAALSAPQSGDWVLVPREASSEMLTAAIDAHLGFEGEDEVDAVWAAMISAAEQFGATAGHAVQDVGDGAEGGSRAPTRPTHFSGMFPRQDDPASSSLSHQAVDAGQFRPAVATHQLACRKRVRDCREGLLPTDNLPIYLEELAEANRLLDVVDRAAPQPPAEAQPAAWLGANPRTGVPVMAVRTPAPSVMRDFAMRPLYAHPPPSAPVGVEAVLRDALQGLIDFIEIDNLPMDADAMFIAKRALAQQPAAVDGADAQDAEIEALRVRADAMAGEAIKHEARAERLAEALRMMVENADDLVAYRHDEDDIGDRPCCQVASYEPHADHCPTHIARAALRDHDQEVSNG